MGMDIKKRLKSIDVRISKLASGLEISRPTLDSYINLYERGEEIPNEKYQEIFNYLFSEENVSAIAFAQKYDYVKRIMLVKAKKEIEDEAAIKRRSFLSGSIVAYANDETTKIETLEFIYLLMRSAQNPAIRLLIEYICLSNGITDWNGKEMTDEEKAYFSSLSKFFDAFKSGDLKIDEKQVAVLLERNAEMNGHRVKKPQEQQLLDYLASHGLDPTSIDFERIKNMLLSKKE